MKTKTGALALLLVLFLVGYMGTASTRQPDVLHVVRPSLIGYQQQVIPSLERTTDDATMVQRLYAAALALPHPKKYPLPCPNDAGLVYQVAFLAGTSQLQQIEVHPLGCSWVYLSQIDVRQANQSFLTLLATTIRLPSLIPAGLLPAS